MKSEAKVISMICKYLMFREAYHELDGEEFISQSPEVYLEKIYVAHEDKERSLSQPRAHVANGYVAVRQQEASNGLLRSLFTLEQELIIREDSINDEVLFPWLTGHFKSAMGESIEAAKLQCARDGVAVNNYLRSFFGRAGIPFDEVSTMHWSIACNVTTAQLFCHWQDDQGGYNMRCFCSANLGASIFNQDRNDHMVFMRKCLRNLLEYAQHERIDKIKEAISAIQLARDAKGKAEAAAPGSTPRSA
ncbi:hypothetical protein OPT61_g1538 [Boeremia exigua]|uniref:Uncharacterized protein n=1 Tax=Boeremia exigua TaxID=749465 RepID=A0ACC2IPT4_9PLEO|nr:hypothetical protein OPT61_g1538 [Boeremia exigua]